MTFQFLVRIGEKKKNNKSLNCVIHINDMKLHRFIHVPYYKINLIIGIDRYLNYTEW